MSEEYIDAAIKLARLYGIAETLNPWEHMDNKEFTTMIEQWTNEYLNTDNKDILSFFESKIIK